MKGLLKSDFRRIWKDKLLIVVGILVLVFALITPLLYVLMFSSLDSAETEMLSGIISGKMQFFSSFSMGNNVGLIAPVLLAIILCKDFSFGTIRNKIIAGKKRTEIYMSLFITCSVVLVAVMMLYAFLTLGVSLIFFEYQATPFTVADFWYFIESLAFELLVLLFVSSMLSWLCANMKNVGLVIVFYVAIMFALIMLGSIAQVVIGVMEMTDGNDAVVTTLKFIDRINVGSAATYIGQGTKYTLEDVLYHTIPEIIGIAGFTGLGLLKFNKKDLK